MAGAKPNANDTQAKAHNRRSLSTGRPSRSGETKSGLVTTPGGAIKESRKKRQSSSSSTSTITTTSTTTNHPQVEIQAVPPPLDTQLDDPMDQPPPAVDPLDGDDELLNEDTIADTMNIEDSFTPISLDHHDLEINQHIANLSVSDPIPTGEDIDGKSPLKKKKKGNKSPKAVSSTTPSSILKGGGNRITSPIPPHIHLFQ